MKKNNLFLLISAIGGGLYQYVANFFDNMLIFVIVYLLYFILARIISEKLVNRREACYQNYKHHRFPPEVLSHCVWFYYRFSLSYRGIELMMHPQDIIVTYESIRCWCIKFGKLFARKHHKAATYGDQHYLW